MEINTNNQYLVGRALTELNGRYTKPYKGRARRMSPFVTRMKNTMVLLCERGRNTDNVVEKCRKKSGFGGGLIVLEEGRRQVA